MKNELQTLGKVLVTMAITMVSHFANAQNNVMMQAFYWNVPTDEIHKDGTWWDSLKAKTPKLKTAGFTALWVPPPSKGNWGISDVGYGLYDHYDLGAYNQKCTTETRYGSKAELVDFLTEAHTAPRIDVYADIVLNHTYGSSDNGCGMNNEEANPSLKAYTFGEAHGGRNKAFQANELKWVLKNAQPGDYYIQIKGYSLPWTASVDERGYNLSVNWTGGKNTDPGNWEFEPNNGSGSNNTISTSGATVRGHMSDPNDIDEYKITVTTAHDIVIFLTAMRDNRTNGWKWDWADQMYGYYPKAIWYNGTNLATTTQFEARTNTKSTYVTHTGLGEANYQWDYSYYHPADAADYLTGWDDNGGNDAIIPNTRGFGNDFNTYNSTVQTRLNDWGTWLTNTIGFDGYRLDFVRGFQVDFVAAWINNLPKVGTAQRYIVGEYWTENTSRLKAWVDDNAAAGATVSVFDFPLRSNLKRVCMEDGYEMHWLNHAGMVRDLTNSISPSQVNTFLDNHDNAKNSNQWITRDWHLGYAYILTHQGRPTVFYNHYYGVAEQDWENGNPSNTITPPASLKEDINYLMFVRKIYLDGNLTVLTEVGNPVGDTKRIYVARRGGNSSKSGAIVAINNAYTEQGVWVDATPAGWPSWNNLWLVNAKNSAERIQVQSSGRVYITAPARGYKLYVLESEYVPYDTTVDTVGEFHPLDLATRQREAHH